MAKGKRSATPSLANNSGSDGSSSDSGSDHGEWGADARIPPRPNWLLLSVVLNFLLLGACVETYVTRMSVGEVVERLESVIDEQMEKDVVTPEQFAIIIDTFIRGLPGVDLPPVSQSTPLDELYEKYLKDRGLTPETAEALNEDDPQLAQQLLDRMRQRAAEQQGGGASDATTPTPQKQATPTPPVLQQEKRKYPLLSPDAGVAGGETPAAEVQQNAVSGAQTFSISIRGEDKVATMQPGDSAAGAAERVCTSEALSVDVCMRWASMVATLPQLQPSLPPLHFVAPTNGLEVPFDGSIPVSLASTIGSVPGCVTIDARRHYKGQAVWCGTLPSTQALALRAHMLRAGPHMLVVRPDDPALPIDVVFFTVKAPALVLSQLSMSQAVLMIDASVSVSALRLCVHVGGGVSGPFLSCVPDGTAGTPTEKGLVKYAVDFDRTLTNGAYAISAVALSKTGNVITRTVEKTFNVKGGVDDTSQRSLQWLTTLPSFDFGFASKNGEDGVIEALAKRFGLWNNDHRAQHGYFVEMDVVDMTTCASRFVEQIFSWTGVRFSSRVQAISAASAPMYKADITADNINSMLVAAKVKREVDLLAITGTTLVCHIFNALDTEAVQARFIVLEVNPAFPPPKAVTVPATVTSWDGVTDYYGASLQALVLVANAKGYTLVYVDNSGERAFFVRNSVLAADVGIVGVMADGQAAMAEAVRASLPPGMTAGNMYKSPNIFNTGGGYAASGDDKVWQGVAA